MRASLTLGALGLALTSPSALGQPDWGPVYHWGQWYEGDITPPTGYFKQVSTGRGYTIGLRPNGSIEVWGDPVGPFFDGDWDDILDTNLPPAGTWLSVEAGWSEAIALNTNGSVHVWGYHFDQAWICDGDELTLEDCEDCLFSAVAAGENIMVGIVEGGDHDGDLFVWGGVACFDPRSLSDEGYIDSGSSDLLCRLRRGRTADHSRLCLLLQPGASRQYISGLQRGHRCRLR